MCKYRNNNPLKGSFSEILWELWNYTHTKCSFTSTFWAPSTLWLCCGSGRHPSSLLPQLCSGTLVCSGGAECCLELDTDACHGDSKELPGRVVRGPGELHEMPSVTFFSCSRDGKLCYLLRREGQSQAFLFCLDSSKAAEIKLQLTQDCGETSFTIFQVIICASGTINLTEVIPDKSKIKRLIWKSRDCSYFSFFKSGGLEFHSASAQCMCTVPIKIKVIISKSHLL